MRYLGYDIGSDPTGLEPEGASLPLLNGIAIHAAHARILAGDNLEAVLTAVIGDYAKEFAARGLADFAVTKDMIREQSAMLEGMLRLFTAVRIPRILEEYSVESIEQSWDWEMAPGLVERIRMDAILRRRDDGLLHILDLKSMGYPSELFFEQKEHDLQTCLYIQALREHTQEPVGGILYEGLIKGQFRKETAKNSPWFGQRVQNGPYTMAYALSGEAGSVYQTDYTSRKGWRKVRPYNEMSVREWVQFHLLPGGEGFTPANELFVSLPLIDPPSSELLQAKQQTINEELTYLTQLEDYQALLRKGNDIEAAALLNRFAPLRRGRCFKYGADNRCKFTMVCFNGVDPLAEGSGFKARTPHHAAPEAE